MVYSFQQRTQRRVRSGHPYPLGATRLNEGVNFALYSKHATAVALLLFDDPHGEPTDVIVLPSRTRHVWHGFVEGIGHGQWYGYRVAGPFDPAMGHRFNPHKVLIDPYAKALSHKMRNEDGLLLGFDRFAQEADLTLDERDNVRLVPKAMVVDDVFDWQGDEPLDVPFRDLVIYETHVRGFTRHDSSKVAHPGTYLGLIEKIPHLLELGVNAVELLPVHEFATEDFLRDKGLLNYWGYNTVSFFAPESSYASSDRPGAAIDEFKTMVRALHRAGIEVILDVVYNHSAEGNELGPTLSLRGIDNRTYYCLTGSPEQPMRRYVNFSGCGNSLNLSDPIVLRLVMDSLRYWVQQMHVDGFRFDLASVLGREGGRFDRSASFFDVVTQDPVLNRVKLIAEPWDIETFEIGNFPIEWCEWNARFRDTMRRFGRGDSGVLSDVGYRLTGSSDLYGHDGRTPYHSINFITCHDGFSLADLVSYNRKHNEANGEDNRDGNDANESWNCGVEGPTTDPEVLSLRRRLVRNHLCHLIFSLGTPMLLGGDEVLRTQGGNNNAYCQDNEISWMNWQWDDEARDFFRFARLALAFRRRHPILRRGQFHRGVDSDGDKLPDISWFGTDLDPVPWGDPNARTLCFRLDGKEAGAEAPRKLLFFILNSDQRGKYVRLPVASLGRWHRVVDTSLPPPMDFVEEGEEVALEPEDGYWVNARSTVILCTK
ncbi:MAG TPA: glycogen debranching protein GlgX [Polyangiaceae bacterium]|nr:glycogen debranching protein GlgX [Polyangiaceae bacterium]